MTHSATNESLKGEVFFFFFFFLTSNIRSAQVNKEPRKEQSWNKINRLTQNKRSIDGESTREHVDCIDTSF